MTFSTVPIIFLAIAGFWIRSTRQALRRREITRAEAHALHSWLGLLAVWGIKSTALALEGVYRSNGFYRTLPGFWVPMIPVAISLILSSSGRHSASHSGSSRRRRRRARSCGSNLCASQRSVAL